MASLFALAVSIAIQSQPSGATGAPDGAPARLTSYEEIVRCAGVTQAASELEGGESAEGRSLSDAALYWSLTAAQAAAAAGRPAAAADADQTRARRSAVRGLGAGTAEARAVLERCRRRTPDLG